MDEVRPRLSPILRMAVKQGSAKAVDVHLKAGANPDARDARGRTALMLAAEAGHECVCRALLGAGADPDLRDDVGVDARLLARSGGFSDIVALLESAGAEALAPESQAAAPAALPPLPDPRATEMHVDDLPKSSSVDFPPRDVEFTSLDILFADDAPLDDASWHPEPEAGPPPENDGSVLEAATSAQTRLSAHVPVDMDADWSDVRIDLPELAELRAVKRRRRQYDEEPVLDLLVAGLRLGWVDPEWIAAATPRASDAPDEPDPVYIANLTRTLADLGVSVDEHPFDPPDLAEALAGASAATDAQEDLAREALSFLRLLNSWRSDTINHWWQSLTQHELLDRDEEVALARTMQDGGREGLMAILLSPAAMHHLLSVGERLEAGEITVEDVLVLAERPEEDPDDGRNEGEDHDSAPLTTEDASGLRPLELDALLDALSRLRSLHGRRLSDPAASSEILLRMRQILEELVLAGGFVRDLHHIVRSDTFAPEASQRLSLALAQAESARQTFVNANLRLVSSIAKRYAHWSVIDAIQEGCIGLMKAVEKFDPHSGNKFSTYGTWWIRQSITRARDDMSRTIRLPVHALETLRKLERAQARISLKTGRQPEIHELAEELEILPEAVRKLLRAPEEPLSLSDPETAAEDVVDLTAPNPEKIAINNELKLMVRAVLEHLGPRQKAVISMRFGLGGYDEHTLEEVGQRFGVTRERIRQIEAKALKRLAHPARSRILRSFLE